MTRFNRRFFLWDDITDFGRNSVRLKPRLMVAITLASFHLMLLSCFNGLASWRQKSEKKRASFFFLLYFAVNFIILLKNINFLRKKAVKQSHSGRQSHLEMLFRILLTKIVCHRFTKMSLYRITGYDMILPFILFYIYLFIYFLLYLFISFIHLFLFCSILFLFIYFTPLVWCLLSLSILFILYFFVWMSGCSRGCKWKCLYIRHKVWHALETSIKCNVG